MAQMQAPGQAKPDINSFLLFVAVLVLLACTAYVIYLGCTYFGAGTFFRTIYSPQKMPQISAGFFGSLRHLLGLF